MQAVSQQDTKACVAAGSPLTIILTHKGLANASNEQEKTLTRFPTFRHSTIDDETKTPGHYNLWSSTLSPIVLRPEA